MIQRKAELVFIFFIMASTISCFSQSTTFEGIVTYSHVEDGLINKRLESPIKCEKVYFSKEKMLNRVTEGDLLSFTGNTALFFDAIRMKRLKINYDRKTVTDIGEEKDLEILNVIVFEKLKKEEVVLSIACDVFLLKYVHSFEAVGDFGKEIRTDTLLTRYYISKSHKISNVKSFSVLQGNRNTKLIDGRFDGIPLKIEINRNDGSRTTILATHIETRNVDEFLDWFSFTKR
jgi:hypothetical protein